MSHDNVEHGMPTDAEAKVRAYFERFNETRESQLDLLHPEIDWHIRADLPDARTLRGYEDVKRRDADWKRAFGDLSPPTHRTTRGIGEDGCARPLPRAPQRQRRHC